MNTEETMDQSNDEWFAGGPAANTAEDRQEQYDPRIEQVAPITALLTKGQGRRFDEEDIHLWANLLDGVDPDLAREATVELLKTSTEFISPALVRQQAQRIGQARLTAVGDPPEPPSGLSNDQYTHWLRSWRQAIMKGAPTPEAERVALTALGPDALKHLDRADHSASIQAKALNMISQRDLET